MCPHMWSVKRVIIEPIENNGILTSIEQYEGALQLGILMVDRDSGTTKVARYASRYYSTRSLPSRCCGQQWWIIEVEFSMLPVPC